MLIRTKPRKKQSNLIWHLAEVMIASLAAFCLFLAARGVLSGEIEILSKRSGAITHATANPVLFWFTVALWFAGGIFLLCVAFNSWRGR
ncbi:hypothetical protein ASD53_19400 [Lysobacter sp. Root559]|nr:hypothetical protein ASD53_19400 [Lysobacter sp. Root559]KRC38027.1 hypothetical protein ASE10_00035 [Lysobacter sp. Root76]KRD69351.1 hypothetical protein ASE45_09320 [Lysobacter sp. Root96]